MKKKDFKSLKLNKKSVSHLDQLASVKGGNSYAGLCQPNSHQNTCLFTCGHCDFPTINDSCFSWCDDKCNDF